MYVCIWRKIWKDTYRVFNIVYREMKRIGRREQTKKPRIYDIQFMHLYKLIYVFFIYRWIDERILNKIKQKGRNNICLKKIM